MKTSLLHLLVVPDLQTMVVSFRDILPPLHIHDGHDCSRTLRTNGNHTHNRLHSRNTLVRILKHMPHTYINFSVYHVCLFFTTVLTVRRYTLPPASVLV